MESNVNICYFKEGGYFCANTQSWHTAIHFGKAY